MGCGASRPELLRGMLLGPPEAEVALRPEDSIALADEELQLCEKHQEEKHQEERLVATSHKYCPEETEKLKHVMLSGRFTQERFITAQVFCNAIVLPTSTLINYQGKLRTNLPSYGQIEL